VFEPFGGSGTTMLAAQRTGRVCRSVEIAPEYVDVAIKRFQQNHPGVPVTLIATGQSFEQVAAERAHRMRGDGMNWLADKIEQWPTAKLLPYARNARTALG
jgi:DNA modification methylase